MYRQISQVRGFSSSKQAQSVLDYFKFFKPKSSTTTSTTPTKDTNQVIQEVESNQESIGKTSTIKILGRKNPRYTDPQIIEQNLNGFQATPWLSKNSTTTPLTVDNYQSQISSTLSSLFSSLKCNPSTSIDNLYLRFKLLKNIQQSFNISIPDSQFTSLATFDQIQAYLITNLNPLLKNSNKTEFQPDALDFDESKFKGTNVSFDKFVFKSEKERKYNNLLKKASQLEKKSLTDYIKHEKST